MVTTKLQTLQLKVMIKVIVPIIDKLIPNIQLVFIKIAITVTVTGLQTRYVDVYEYFGFQHSAV